MSTYLLDPLLPSAKSIAYCLTDPKYTLCRLVELLQSGDKSGETTQATNSLTALLNGGPPRKASVRAHARFDSHTYAYPDQMPAWMGGS